MKRILLSLALLSCINIYSQYVSLDTTFGINGLTDISLETTGDSHINSKIQSDGKILISGSRINGPNNNEDFIARYNADGTIDNSFGNNGFYVFNNSINDYNGPDFFLLNSGKIVSISSNTKAEIIKLNTDGTIDNSFGTQGKISFNQVDDYSQFLDSNENLYVGFGNQRLSRINTLTGIIDNSFGTNGQLAFSTFFDYIYSFKNNKFLVSAFTDTTPSDSFSLMRFNIDGSTDTSFGNNGTLALFTTNNFNDFDYVTDNVTLDTDGNIYVNENNSSNMSATIRKYDSNGILITSFGNSGISNIPSNNLCTSVQLFNNNLYLSGGNVTNGLNLSILKFNTNGSIDNAFSANGVYVEDSNSLQEWAESMNINSDGSIIIAGEYKNGTNNKIYLAKYKSNNLSIPENHYKGLNYSNPVENELVVNSENEIKLIELFGIDGKLIKSANSNLIWTNDIETGVYTAKITFINNETKTIKVAKR